MKMYHVLLKRGTKRKVAQIKDSIDSSPKMKMKRLPKNLDDVKMVSFMNVYFKKSMKSIEISKIS